MPQMHFYVSEDVAEDLRRRARAKRMSVSKYIASLVRTKIHPGWPEGYFENVIGAWKGRTFDRPPQGEFERREKF